MNCLSYELEATKRAQRTKGIFICSSTNPRSNYSFKIRMKASDKVRMKFNHLLILISILFSISDRSYSQSYRPIGSTDSGHLINADCLPETGEGYMQLFRDVERIWGTMPLIDMIQKSAADLSRMFPKRDRLQVEEMSAKGGGRIDGHKSHTNGLDVDLGFFKVDGIEHDPVAKKQHYADPMVIDGKVSANFDIERNWEFMKALHRHGNVHKIFVDSVLKKELCKFAKSKNDYSGNIQVLRSLRHEINHADHLHVRLRCLANEKKCVNRPDPPAGSGC